MPKKEPRLLEHRTGAGETAVIFIHGFNGNAGESTWGEFPDYLKQNRALVNWDIYSLGYATRFSIDLRSIWRANPDIPKLARYLHTRCVNPPLNRYKSLALVAHSMGGLVVQRALADLRCQPCVSVRHSQRWLGKGIALQHAEPTGQGYGV